MANRGSGVTVLLPTEPVAGPAEDAKVVAVLVMDGDVHILEHELSEGAAITFRVGGTFRAYMERINTDVPFPDDLWLVAHKSNRDPVVLEWEDALSGNEKKSMKPGELFELNPTLMRRWRMSAKRWGEA
ncbi:MAG: hypothetical protein OXL41_10610 [Nitrospinae bacterium]|nr:hypothetical protein [Nitrospinota bacterium]